MQKNFSLALGLSILLIYFMIFSSRFFSFSPTYFLKNQLTNDSSWNEKVFEACKVLHPINNSEEEHFIASHFRVKGNQTTCHLNIKSEIFSFLKITFYSTTWLVVYDSLKNELFSYQYYFEWLSPVVCIPLFAALILSLLKFKKTYFYLCLVLFFILVFGGNGFLLAKAFYQSINRVIMQKQMLLVLGLYGGYRVWAKRPGILPWLVLPLSLFQSLFFSFSLWFQATRSRGLFLRRITFLSTLSILLFFGYYSSAKNLLMAPLYFVLSILIFLKPSLREKKPLCFPFLKRKTTTASIGVSMLILLLIAALPGTLEATSLKSSIPLWFQADPVQPDYRTLLSIIFSQWLGGKISLDFSILGPLDTSQKMEAWLCGTFLCPFSLFYLLPVLISRQWNLFNLYRLRLLQIIVPLLLYFFMLAFDAITHFKVVEMVLYLFIVVTLKGIELETKNQKNIRRWLNRF